MKYPQLVSTRAVNAISDWLVSRLEQLGVEAPQIYTRLLLSLLQSSVQINDPIEFSNLETFFAHRKGSNRRYHPFDTNTIKKINAVQCLSDIVSSEQEIASIETLVDELFEKLIDIEKKLTDIEDDEQILVATLSVATTSLGSEVNHSNYSHHLKKHHKEIGESGLNFDNGSDNNFITTTSNTKVGEDECKSKRIIDNETDPKKQYFRAFPALTKEMEDSFRILRRNAKSLTWPVDKYKIASLTLSNGEKNITQSLDTNGNKESEKRQIESNSGEILSGGQNQVENVHGSINSNCLFATTGVKRKTKRRRNQALSKGKTIQNIRKTSCSGVGGSSNRYRSSSPFWDTDFEGCWEMGRDLIKEFIVKQNNRNRSTSESAAYTSMNHQLNALEDHEMLQLQQEPLDKIDKTTSKITKQSSPLIPPVDISFCYTESSPQPPLNAENDDDTLASLSEITDASLNSARPLYKRDISGGSQEILPGETNDDELDFAQFKAKFDSSLEALWNSMDADAIGESKNESSSDVYSMSSSIMQLSSLPPTVAPFKENLQNFWTNYYNHHFDLTKISSQTPERTDAANEMNLGFSWSAFGKDTTYTSDYCSMPSNLEEFDKSSFKMRRNGNCCEGIETPINVFLQNSIWSKNPTVGAGDTDESFYKKAWNSAQKVTQKLDSLCGNVDSTTNDNSFHLPQYSKSKWSEGINIGPNASMPVQSQQPQLIVQVSGASTSSSTTISSCSAEQVGKHSNDIGSIFNIERHHGTVGGNSGIVGIDCTDSSTTSTSTTSCSSYPHSSTYNWQTPLLGQSLQPDMQSWSSSNPISLTEMYESGTNVQQQFDGKHVMAKFFVPPIAANELNSVGPVVTLKNHSSTASGFIEYSRIKSAIKIIKQEQIKQPNALQQQEQQYLAKNKEQQQQQRYAEDENENLLTSDRTHFHPIKTYADGHSFDICGSLDVVEYERSQSGYLCLDNDRYLEYTRNDTFLAEEDTTTLSSLHTQPFGGVPLYASSNCEAANYLENAIENQCDFVIKFRIRNCEMACQTDDEPPNKIATMSNDLQSTSTVIEQQHPLCLIFSSSLQGMKLQTTGLACNDAIEALNKAVAAAAKAAASTRNSSDSHWLPNAVTNYRNTAAGTWQTSKTKNIESGNADEVDFQSVDAGDNNCCSLNALEQWSMLEIGKKCELQGHDNNAEAHSLWGLCVACNNEFKSIPANRLLKDELQLEADEIMSDLKYMQDLYISEGAAAGDSDSDWDIGETLDDTTMVVVGDKNIADIEEVENESACNKNDDEKRVMKESPLDTQVNLCQQKQAAQAVLHKVNRLIADLLCRENSKTFGNVINSSTASLQAAADEVELPSSLKSPQSSQFIGSLWSCNDEHNIWQQNQTNAATFKPFDFLKELSDGQQKSTVLAVDEDSLLSHLSWEHDNLAEIWEKRTPSPLTQNASNKAVKNLNVAEINKKIEESSYNESAETQKRNVNAVPISSSTVATTTTTDIELCSDAARSLETNEQIKPNAAYKRVQQFLTANATAASTAFKLKISNRKRRHSASQNLFHISPNSTTINNHHITNNNNFNNNNNNNNKTADLNQFNAVVNTNPFKAEIEMQNLIKANSTENDYGYEDDDLYVGGVNEATTLDAAVNITQPKQTIITCKYWTTLDPLTCSPTATTEDMVEGATTTFSCLLDKNASILKHVTMVTRPLTR